MTLASVTLGFVVCGLVLRANRHDFIELCRRHRHMDEEQGRWSPALRVCETYSYSMAANFSNNSRRETGVGFSAGNDGLDALLSLAESATEVEFQLAQHLDEAGKGRADARRIRRLACQLSAILRRLRLQMRPDRAQTARLG